VEVADVGDRAAIGGGRARDLDRARLAVRREAVVDDELDGGEADRSSASSAPRSTSRPAAASGPPSGRLTWTRTTRTLDGRTAPARRLLFANSYARASAL